jgi:hypothetical protein
MEFITTKPLPMPDSDLPCMGDSGLLDGPVRVREPVRTRLFTGKFTLALLPYCQAPRRR